ncbi:MAG: hypothetical protein K1X89_31275 [Myxococcaceae bacterium]|nr:hypothetical protein [Myxococcaceae bacterium]
MTRGQAVVETALGLTVAVTVLVAGIVFAEWGFSALKVHEAAAAALWDTTARPMHRLPRSFEPRDEAIAGAGPGTSARYAGFDGRSDFVGRTGASWALTRARDLEVRCVPDRVVTTSAARRPSYPGGEGGMRCSASARVELFEERVAVHALDEPGKGFFSVPQFSGPTAIAVCGLGRARGGVCPTAGYPLLLDAWALEGPRETDTCGFRRCANQPFHDLVERFYERALRQNVDPDVARRFAGAVVPGPSPGRPADTFWFSAVDRRQGDPGFTRGDQDPGHWMTNVRTGSRNVRYEDRGEHFLGLGGAR